MEQEDSVYFITMICVLRTFSFLKKSNICDGFITINMGKITAC